jgi:uncharacterized protein YuzE
VYSGETEPANPSEEVWWYNLVTCDTKRWTDYKSYGETRTKWNESAILQYKSIWEEKYPLDKLEEHKKPYPIVRGLSPQDPLYVLEKDDATPYVAPDGVWEKISVEQLVPKYKFKIKTELVYQTDPPVLGQPEEIEVLDENGNPIIELDENGNPIIELDENGNPIIELDENGQGLTVVNVSQHWESTSPGYWTDVSNEDREAKWFGSSNDFGAPHANYLAYSNRDGSIFGLLKFV